MAYRRREPERRGGLKSNNNGVVAECDCHRKIRLSRSVYEAGLIACGVCGSPFLADNVTVRADPARLQQIPPWSTGDRSGTAPDQPA
ncbi:hypothetical protein GCM10027262_62080 [Nocardia tengchongensis]